MSLINDALKKAQRSRGAEPGDLAPPMPAGNGRIAKRGQPLSAKIILLYGSGVLVLFVLAVVGTVYFLNRPAAPTSVAQKPVPTPSAKAPETAPPTIVAPVSLPPIGPAAPVAVAPPPEKPVPTANTPKAPEPRPASPIVPSPIAPATASAAPTSTPSAAPQPVAPPVPALPNERVHLYLDALHVTAVRLQPGSESRVMMNERVYRVNDIVDRTLSLRLVKVEPNQLTFSDANGVTYVKYL